MTEGGKIVHIFMTVMGMRIIFPIMAAEEVLKSDLKKSQICLSLDQSEQLWPKLDISVSRVFHHICLNFASILSHILECWSYVMTLVDRDVKIGMRIGSNWPQMEQICIAPRQNVLNLI